MNMLKKLPICLILLLLSSYSIQSQRSDIIDIVESFKAHDNTLKRVSINTQEIKKSAITKTSRITLPYIDSEREFIMTEFSMWGDKKNPYDDFFTYKIVDTKDPFIKGRLIVSGDEIFITYLYKSKMIRYYSTIEKGVRSYYREIGIGNKGQHHECGQHGDITQQESMSGIKEESEKVPEKKNGSTKRKYRVAVVVTGEYFEFSGNFGAARTRAVANLSDISAIFEDELSIELVMSDRSPELQYTNSTTDPFDPSFGLRPTQAKNVIEDLFDSSTYELGHVFHIHSSGDGWVTGGQAGLGVVCKENGNFNKASGWSGSFNNVGNGFVYLAAHEFAHMFDATHTFNGGGGSCEDNISESTAYEIGSGTTIMSYQGICEDDQNIPASGILDNYFHVNSLDRMISYVETEGVCNENEWTRDNNTPPVANANPCGTTYILPRRTPFFLNGEGFDADGDNLTYCWEQYDEDGPSTPTQGFVGTRARTSIVAPLFRSFPPTTRTERYFPNQEDVLDGIGNDDFEVLPAVPRNIKFRLTVRDNNPNGGGVDWDEIDIDVVREGPLKLTFPNGSETIQAGESIEVTWDPDGSEEFCERATIKASFDGGISFPITLASNVEYRSGVINSIIPAGFSNSEEVRFMIMCADSECFSFYDISDQDFTIESNCTAPNVLLCDDEPETFDANDPALNLSLQALQGTPISVYDEPIAANATMVPGVMNISGECVRPGFPDNPFQALPFQVSKTGSYNIGVNLAIDDIVVYTVYDAATFDPSDPCDSYVASNSTFDNQLTFSAGVAAELEACKEYLLVGYRSSNDREFISIRSIRGPGSVIFPEDIPDFSVAYIAVEQSSGVITAANLDSDFRTIPPGVYDLQAISYKSGGITPPDIVDPLIWIGRTATDVLNDGPCFNTGLNSKEITVISSCSVRDIVLGVQSPCDPGSNTYSQALSFFVDKGPGMGELNVNGQSFPVTGENLNILLTDLPADGQAVSLRFEFSADGSCNRTFDDVFTAPENCCPILLDLPDFISGCGNTPEELDAGPDGLTYSWIKDSAAFSDERIISITESGIYSVTVDNGLCTKSDVVEVRFNDIPSLAIGPDVSGCDGNPEIVTVSSSADSIVWIQNGMEVAVNTLTYGVVTSGAVEVIVTNEFGCSTSSSFDATFTESPIIELGDDEILCEGTPKELTTGDSGNVYEWFQGTTLLAETSNTLNVTVSGEYNVVATNSNGCPSRDTVNITFSDLPELDLGDDVRQCASELFTLSANANGFVVEWYLDDDLLIDEMDDDLIAQVSGEYIARVSAGVDCEISDTVVVDYIDAPTIELGDDRSACPGEIIMLDGGDDSNTIVWSSELDGILPTTDNMLSVSSSDTYYITSTNSDDCISRDTVTITFTELPMLDLGNDEVRCQGDTFTINAETNGFEIEWFLDTDLIIDENDDQLTVTVSGTYQAVVSANLTCSITDELVVTFNELPELTPINDLSPCEGDEVILVAGADGEYDYRWTQGAALVQEGDMGSFDVQADGEYIVTAVNEFMCSKSDTATIAFIDTPIITIDESLSFCEGTTGVIVADANALIEWYDPDNNIIPNQSGPMLEVTESGEYRGVVGAGGSCATADTIQVMVVTAPVFTLDGVMEACAGDEIELTIDGATSETIVWMNGDDIIPNEDSDSYTATGSGIYTAELTNGTDCTSEQEIAVVFFELAENEIETVPTTLCDGDTFTMEAVTNGSRFAWAQDGVILTDEDQLSFDIEVSGKYSFIGYNEIDCETVTDFIVEFNPAPVADLGDDMRTECLGFAVDLEVTEDAGSTYTWSQNGAVISEESMITVNDTPGTYSVSVTNSFGCSDTDETIITFNEPPSLSIDDEASFCEGLDVTLDVDTDAASINWLLGTDIVEQDASTYTASEEGTYTVEVISSDGCAISQEVIVTQNDNPVLSISDIELCPNESMDIVIDPDFASYDWTGINASGSDAAITYQDVTDITTENASLSVVDNNGCIASEDFAITYFPIINAGVADEVIEICIGESAELRASGGLMYMWDDPDGTLTDATIASPIAMPLTTTTYDVEVSDNCPGNIAELTVVVVVNDLPIADAGPDTCALVGIPFQLDAMGGVDYSWDNTDVFEGSSDVADAIINISEATTFTVTVTDDSGCMATDQVIICVDDPRDELEPVTIITPNGDGVNDELSFRGLEAFPDNELTIFNRWGTVVFNKNGYQNDLVRWSATRDGVDLPADTYYYILTFSDISIKKSITVLRN